MSELSDSDSDMKKNSLYPNISTDPNYYTYFNKYQHKCTLCQINPFININKFIAIIPRTTAKKILENEQPKYQLKLIESYIQENMSRAFPNGKLVGKTNGIKLYELFKKIKTDNPDFALQIKDLSEEFKRSITAHYYRSTWLISYIWK